MVVAKALSPQPRFLPRAVQPVNRAHWRLLRRNIGKFPLT
jgi:hypothetical protein